MDVPFSTTWGRTLAACGNGYTLVADGADRHEHARTRVWTSADGRAWSEEDGLRPAPGTDPSWSVTALVSFRGRLYALGGEDRRLMVWRSADCGRSWTRIRDPRFALGPGSIGLTHGVAAVATGTRMVVIGRQGGEEIPRRSWAWTLDPGGIWGRIPGGLEGIGGLVVDGDGFAASRGTGTGVSMNDEELLTSPDGVNWTAAGLMPPDVGPIPDPDRGGYLTARDEGNLPPRTPTLWRSADGSTWAPIAQGRPTDRCCSDLTAGDGLLVWIVGGGPMEPDVPWSWIGISDDEGSTWSVSAGWPGMDLQGGTSVVISPDAVLIAAGGLDRVQVWVMPR